MWYGTAPTERPHDNSIASYSLDGQPSTTFTVPGVPAEQTEYNRFYFQTPALLLGHHNIVVTSGGLATETPMVLSYIIIQGGSVQEPPRLPPTTAQPGAGLPTTAPPPAVSSFATTIMVSNGVSITQTQLLPPSISSTSGASTSANVTGITNTGQPTSAGDNATRPTGSTSSDSSNTGDTKSTAVRGSGTSIGAIVGGILGALLLIAIMLIIFWRRRKTRQQKNLEKVQVQQPFYSDIVQSQRDFNPVHSGNAFSSPGQSAFHSAHMHHRYHDGNTGGTFNYSAENSNVSNLPSRGPEASARSEATLRSPHGSVASLLLSGRDSSRHAEGLVESLPQPYPAHHTPESSTNHSWVMDHEDSGYRMQLSGPSGSVLESPPAYTTY